MLPFSKALIKTWLLSNECTNEQLLHTITGSLQYIFHMYGRGCIQKKQYIAVRITRSQVYKVLNRHLRRPSSTETPSCDNPYRHTILELTGIIFEHIEELSDTFDANEAILE